jgi:type IV secretion system protein VirD4
MVEALDAARGIMRLGAWAQANPGQVTAAFVAVPVIVGTAGLLLGPGQTSRPETCGSARWPTRREIKTAGLIGTHGVGLGRIGDSYLCHDGPEHVLLVGPTRSGKGVSTIIPTLVGWRESALVLDPKDGENDEVTATWRETLGPSMRSPRWRAHTRASTC